MKLSFFNLKNRKIKVGLALGGGGARGFAHIGVIKALVEHGINIDFVAGTSAGAIVGALYAAGLSVEEMVEISNKFSLKDIKTSKIPLIPNKIEALQEVIKKTLGDIEFKDLEKPFCAVAVDIKTGSEVHITKGNLAAAVAGSCAVPGFFTSVTFDNYMLFDGGLLNNIPSNVPKLFGCDVVIAVDINSTRGQGTTSTKYFDQLISSISIMMKSNSLKGYLNADIMIQPDLKRFKSTKIISVSESIEEGYNATIFKMDEIKQLLGVKTNVKKETKLANKINSKNKLII